MVDEPEPDPLEPEDPEPEDPEPVDPEPLDPEPEALVLRVLDEPDPAAPEPDTSPDCRSVPAAATAAPDVGVGVEVGVGVGVSVGVGVGLGLGDDDGSTLAKATGWAWPAPPTAVPRPKAARTAKDPRMIFVGRARPVVALGGATSAAGVGWVWSVHRRPSHQRTTCGVVPSGYQPAGGGLLCMKQNDGGRPRRAPLRLPRDR